MAFAPYSSVAGPRTTSMRSAAAGFTLTPWSPDWLDKSPVRWPSCRICTRSPSSPRMTGRDGAEPEAARRDAGLVLERRAERALELLGQLLARQHRRRLERVELAARFGAHRCDFLEMQIEIDAQLDRSAARRGHGDFRAPRRVSLRAHPHVIRAGREIVEAERAVRSGHDLALQLVDDHRRAGERIAVQRIDQPSLEHSGGLAKCGAGRLPRSAATEIRTFMKTPSKNLYGVRTSAAAVRRTRSPAGPVEPDCGTVSKRAARGRERASTPASRARSIGAMCSRSARGRVVMLLEFVEGRVERTKGMTEEAVFGVGRRRCRVRPDVVGAFVVRDQDRAARDISARPHAAARGCRRSGWRRSRSADTSTADPRLAAEHRIQLSTEPHRFFVRASSIQ